LFKNKIAGAILRDAGNIPVERKAADKSSIFKGSFDVLAENEVVALFPEGTSYTEPRIMQVKDGAAWAALEYTKWSQSEEGKAKGAQELYLIPAGVVYTNKAKYRSSVIVE
jgi:glycerol-3-phosphate O-acyltransferase / dihydroxyacetone phosphate acyltransferase